MGAAAFALNLVGITWGLPARWHPDEKADAASRMMRTGTLRPESFINPSLPLYGQMPMLWLQDRVADVGLVAGRAADHLLASRALSALLAALAVVVLGRALVGGDAAEGLLAAALLALAPGVVNLSHFATPEPWLLLGSAATLFAAVRHVEGRAPAAVLGAALGLAAATKYTAAALALPCLLAVLMCAQRRWRRWEGIATTAAGASGLVAGAFLLGGAGATVAAGLGFGDPRLLHAESALAFVRGLGMAALLGGSALAGAGALALGSSAFARRLARAEVLVMGTMAAVAFVAATPYALVDPRAFVTDLAYNQQTRHEYKGLADASTSFGPYLGLLADAVTGPVAVAAGVGSLIALAAGWAGDRRRLIVLAAAAAPFLLVASSGHRAMRFLTPALPAVAALAALALRTIPSASVRRPLTMALLARAALGALLVVRLFFVDSRTLAARWITAHVPPGEVVDLIANNPGYAPAVAPERLRVVPTLSREMAPPERFREAADRYPAEASRWLVLTAAYYERFLDHPEQAPERARFFSDLLQGRGGFEVVARFRQTGWRRPEAEFVDPEIVILRKRE